MNRLKFFCLWVLLALVVVNGATGATESDLEKLISADWDRNANNFENFREDGISRQEMNIIWAGDVTLSPGNFTVFPDDRPTEQYEVDRLTPLGTLDAAADEGGFDYGVVALDDDNGDLLLVTRINQIEIKEEPDGTIWAWIFYDFTNMNIYAPGNTVQVNDGDYWWIGYTELKDDGIGNVTDIIVMNITIIDDDLRADFSAEPIAGKAPLTVDFTDLSTPADSIETWSWDFGAENATSTDQNPSYTYQDEGTYSVTLTVTDAMNVSDTKEKTDFITVTNETDVGANFTADVTEGPAHLDVQFNDTSTIDNITEWHWDFGNGFMSTRQNPLFTYHGNGTYTVTLTVKDAANETYTEMKEDYITVGPDKEAPVADFTADVTKGPAPLTVVFTDLSTVASEWAWDFGDGATSDEQSPSHTYVENGTFTVNLTASNIFGNDTVSKPGYITVTVGMPAANFTADPTSGTFPLDVQFTDTSIGFNITEWAWDFGDGGISDEQNPSYTYQDEGTYTVILTIKDVDNETDTETKEDYISVGPSGDGADPYFPFPDTIAERRNYSPSGMITSFYVGQYIANRGGAGSVYLEVTATDGGNADILPASKVFEMNESEYVIAYVRGQVSGMYTSFPASDWKVRPAGQGDADQKDVIIRRDVEIPEEPAVSAIHAPNRIETDAVTEVWSTMSDAALNTSGNSAVKILDDYLRVSQTD